MLRISGIIACSLINNIKCENDVVNRQLLNLKSILDRAKMINSMHEFAPELRNFIKELLLVEDPLRQHLIKEMAEWQSHVNTLAGFKRRAFIQIQDVVKSIDDYFQSLQDQSLFYTEQVRFIQDRLNNIEEDLLQIVAQVERLLCSLCHDNQYDHTAFVSRFAEIIGEGEYRTIKTYTCFGDYYALENEKFYVFQEKQGTVAYSLDQLWAFFQRFDGRTFDVLIKALTEKKLSVVNLQDEHSILFRYVHFDGSVDNTFPSRDEYVLHMQRVFDFLNNKILVSDAFQTAKVKTIFEYRYRDASGERSGTVKQGKQSRKLIGNSAYLVQQVVLKRSLHWQDVMDGMSTKKGEASKGTVDSARNVANRAFRNFQISKQIILSNNGTMRINSCAEIKLLD